MASIMEVCVAICLFIWAVAGQITVVPYVPEVTPYNLAAKITTNTVILKQPRCIFPNETLTKCGDQCKIYLVSAINSGDSNFDKDKTNPTIVSLSPYPSAFTNNESKNYFLTAVGLSKDFPCQEPASITFFRVGAEGKCSTANCNGILPPGSKARFKYLLINTTSTTVLMETQWSSTVNLLTSKNSAEMDDSIGGRSAGMIVVTSILSVMLALLVLLLLGGLIYAKCCRYRPEPMPVLGSLRIKRYDTHHMKDPLPYVNQSYEGEKQKFETPEVLAQSPEARFNPELPDSVKLKRYNNYNFDQKNSENS